MKDMILSMILLLEIISNQTRNETPKFIKNADRVSRLIWPPICKTLEHKQSFKEEVLC
jgi:hypothetical protein